MIELFGGGRLKRVIDLLLLNIMIFEFEDIVIIIIIRILCYYVDRIGFVLCCFLKSNVFIKER